MPRTSCDEPQELAENKVYQRIIIDDVSFEGPIHLPSADLDQLKRFMTINKFNGQFDWLSIITWTELEPAWHDQGYYHAHFTGRAIPRGGDDTTGHFSVIFHVDEGSVYRVGDITFLSWYRDVPLVFRADELRNAIPLSPGGLYRPAKIGEGMEALRTMYARKGYVEMNPTPETKVDENRHLISVNFVLNQHKQFRIRRVTVCGSNPDFDNLLKSEIRPGNVFDYAGIQDFFAKHGSELGPQLGSENVQYDRDAKSGTVDITVSLRNCPGPQG